MKIKQILRLTLFLPLTYYIYISQNYEDNILIRESLYNKYVSEKFKVDKEGDIVFNISGKSWPFKNYLDNELLLLSIKFDSAVNATHSNLIFKLKAYTVDKGKVLDRLILYDYVKTSDETVFRNCQMFGDEYQLGLIPNFSSEDIIIKMTVSQADSVLNHLNPRLKIETYKGSPGVYGFAGLSVLLKNAILLISIICIIIYVIIGQTNETRNKPSR